MKIQASSILWKPLVTKRNFIVTLTKADGSIISNHDQKAQLIWTAFKERLGKSEFSGIVYDLSSILIEIDLDHLGVDFTQ